MKKWDPTFRLGNNLILLKKAFVTLSCTIKLYATQDLLFLRHVQNYQDKNY